MYAIVPDGKTTDWNFRVCTLLCPLYNTFCCSVSRPVNWSHCSTNESETVIEWSTLPENRVTVHLKRSRVEQLWIPSGDAMHLGIENKVNNAVTNHTEDRNSPSKTGNQVAVATRIRHSPQYHAQTLHSVTHCSLSTGKLVWNP